MNKVEAEKRILALDIGEKRIGMAVSDPLFITAQGIMTLERTNWRADVKAVGEVIREYSVTEVVVGLPKSLDGSIGPSAERVRDFVEKMKRSIHLPIVEWDERFSTAAVERTLIEADVRRKKRREVIDKVAAQFILQGYMDFKRMDGSSGPWT